MAVTSEVTDWLPIAKYELSRDTNTGQVYSEHFPTRVRPLVPSPREYAPYHLSPADEPPASAVATPDNTTQGNLLAHSSTYRRKHLDLCYAHLTLAVAKVSLRPFLHLRTTARAADNDLAVGTRG